MALVAVPGGAIELEWLGHGEPLLLLHGWTQDRRVWTPQFAALSDRFRLIAPDRRGFGRSTAPPDLAGEPEDIVHILDSLEIDRVSIVATSQGVRSALAFAAEWPHRLKRLVVQGGPPLDPAIAASELPVASLAALVRAGDMAGFRDQLSRHPLMDIGGSAANGEVARRMLAEYSGRDLIAPGRALPIDIGQLARIEAPTLIVVGDRETPVRKAAATELRQHLRQASLRQLPGGHLCGLTDPAPFNAILLEFLIDTPDEKDSVP
jgi:pimeloyl-ACP methyl ester carboxylesterase